jgi:hypothetical protein
MANFPNPQLMADAQALNVFGQAMSQAAVQLVNFSDKASPEYEALKVYFKENLPKLKVIVENLEADLG